MIEERKLTKTLKFVNQRFENAIRKANCEPSEPIRERIHPRAQEWALKLSHFSVDDETHQTDHSHDDQEDAILVSSSIKPKFLLKKKLAFTAKILKEFFFAQKLEQEIKKSRNTEDLSSVASSCSTLNYKLLHFTDKPIMDFIGDAINDKEISANDLLRLITFSRVESTRTLDNPSSAIQQIQKTSFATAAANVITILNHLRYNFKGMDLRAISIPGADLQDGDFDSTDFTGADLSGVNFNRAWLKHSSLMKTNLSEAVFGEWPVFTLNRDIRCIAYSRNGRYMAVGVKNELVILERDIKNALLKEIKRFRGHMSNTNSCCFSPDCKLVASSEMQHHAVRVWDLAKGICICIFIDSGEPIRTCLFSPKNKSNRKN